MEFLSTSNLRCKRRRAEVCMHGVSYVVLNNSMLLYIGYDGFRDVE